MNACVVITAASQRVTVYSGGRGGIAIRVEGINPDLDLHVDLDSQLAREIAGTLMDLAAAVDEDDE